jgi:hypothetical protein
LDAVRRKSEAGLVEEGNGDAVTHSGSTGILNLKGGGGDEKIKGMGKGKGIEVDNGAGIGAFDFSTPARRDHSKKELNMARLNISNFSMLASLLGVSGEGTKMQIAESVVQALERRDAGKGDGSDKKDDRDEEHSDDDVPEPSSEIEDEGSDEGIAVRVKVDRRTVKLHLRVTALIVDLKLGLKSLLKLRVDDQRILYDDIDISDDVSVMDTIAGKHNQFVMKLRGLGGGKRARAADGAQFSKDTRLRQIKEEAGTTIMRLNAAPGISPAITDIVRICTNVGRELQERPDACVTFLLTQVDDDKMKKLLTVTASNGTETRQKEMAYVIFATQHNMLEELRRQIGYAESLMHSTTHACMVSQLGDASGSVAWATFTDMVSNTITERAVGRARNEAAM